MQYFRLALSLAWPQIVVAVLWLVVALAALYYARATRRPIFLFGGIAALLLSLSEVLSPIRLAYRYFTNRVYCPSTAACTTELRFGAAKFEWVIVGIAALIFLAGLYLEVSRARRRAAANSAARAAVNQRAMDAAPAEGLAPAGAFVGQYQTAPQGQPVSNYGATLPDSYGPAFSEDAASLTQASDLAAASESEQPTLYRRPATGSSSGTF